MDSFYKNEYLNECIDRYFENGLEKFSDSEALELLLLYTLPIHRARAASETLLGHFGSFENVLSADVSALLEVGGVDRETAALVSLIRNLAARRYESDERISLNTPEEEKRFALDFFRFSSSDEAVLLPIRDNSVLLRPYKLFDSMGRYSFESADAAALGLSQRSADGGLLMFYRPKRTELETDDRKSMADVRTVLEDRGITLVDCVLVLENEAVSFADDLRYISLLY